MRNYCSGQDIQTKDEVRCSQTPHLKQSAFVLTWNHLIFKEMFLLASLVVFTENKLITKILGSRCPNWLQDFFIIGNFTWYKYLHHGTSVLGGMHHRKFPPMEYQRSRPKRRSRGIVGSIFLYWARWCSKSASFVEYVHHVVRPKWFSYTSTCTECSPQSTNMHLLSKNHLRTQFKPHFKIKYNKYERKLVATN